MFICDHRNKLLALYREFINFYNRCWASAFVVTVLFGCIIGLGLSRPAYGASNSLPPVSISFYQSHASVEDMSEWVLNIEQDAQGFIWAATQTGLFRYDGYETVVFTYKADDPYSLANSYVVSLFLDSDDQLWVGTHDGVLHRYDNKLNRFERYNFDPDYPKTARSNSHVMGISQNSKYQLLVSTLGAGLHIFDLKTRKFIKRYINDPSDHNSLSDDKVYTAIEDSQGMVWVGTRNGGLNRLDPQTGKFKRFAYQEDNPKSLSNNKVYAIKEDSKRNLWIGTRGGGLNLFDRISENFTHFIHDPQDLTTLGSDQVFTIFEDKNNTLWLGTYKGGLNKFNAERRSFTRYQHIPQSNNSLPDNDVFSLIQDDQGLIWLGTFGGSISRFDPNSERFGLVRHHAGVDNTIVDAQIHAMTKDRQGILWIGTDKGLNRLDERSGKFSLYANDEDDELSLSGNEIWSIVEDPQQGLWVGTRTSGLNFFDSVTGKSKRFKHDVNDNNSLSDDYVKELHFDGQGQLWIGTQNGLNRYDKRSGTFTRFIHDENNLGSISHNVINEIFTDKQGRLWIGTNGGGLNRFLPANNTFERFIKDPDNNSISSNTVYSLIQDEQDIFWIGTFGGLNRFDISTREFTVYDQSDGLQSDRVQGVIRDESGKLWLVGRGLSVFDPKTTKNRYRIGSDFDCSANQGATLKDERGVIYFGTNGFCHFNPKDIELEDSLPEVVFTDFLLLNKSVKVGETFGQEQAVLTEGINDVEQITLTHEQNVLSFEFAALDYTAPKDNQYKYKLTGFNPNWIETDSSNRHATYTNLSAGNYTFMVLASNHEGIWSVVPKTVNLRILPAPWHTWWAYTFYGLVILLVAYSYGRMIHQSVMIERETSRKLEQKVSERTFELERSNQSITALSEISVEISSTLDLNQLLNTVYERIKRLMDVDVFSIGIYDEKSNRIDFKLVIEQGRYLPEYSIDMKEKDRPAIWCIQHRQPVILNDYEKDFAKLLGNKPIPLPKIGNQAKSLMYWPLIVGDNISGVLTVQSYRKDAYDEHQQEMIQTLATTTAIALDNASAYREVETKNETIVATQQQLVESEKMASLGILTAGVAHEINNPTNFVHVAAHNLTTDMATFKQVLMDMVGDDAEAEVYEVFDQHFKPLFSHIDLITTGTERIKRIVEDLSSFSQLDAEQKQTMNIIDGLLSTINLVHTKYADQISIDTDFYPISEIKGFPAELNQVFMNLLVNACDAIRDRCRAEKEAGLMKALLVAGQIKVGCQPCAEGIEITFKDNGCGMNETTRDKLFEPFYTTKAAGEGTGLGLSISYGIIQKHNGDISVESEEGYGTTFIIRLPLE